jgi:hypothetical protein
MCKKYGRKNEISVIINKEIRENQKLNYGHVLIMNGVSQRRF